MLPGRLLCLLPLLLCLLPLLLAPRLLLLLRLALVVLLLLRLLCRPQAPLAAATARTAQGAGA